MSERPIIMTSDSINQIIHSGKRQTRRVVRPQPPAEWHEPEEGIAWRGPGAGFTGRQRVIVGEHLGEPIVGEEDVAFPVAVCPYGVPGDRLWVKETWARVGVVTDPESGYVEGAFDDPNGRVWYASDFADDWEPGRMSREERGFTWRTPIFMPRKLSRLTLVITEIRAERLQEISEIDALDEGIVREELPRDPDNFHPPGSYGFIAIKGRGIIHQTPQQAYQQTWDALNAKRGFPWSSNPWVWCITFEQEKQG